MERVRQWVGGWVLCRDAPDPVEEHDGFRVDVGRAGHRVRYVIAGTSSVRERAAVTTPGTWLKVCAPRADVLPLLGPEWSVGAPEFLMSVVLDGAGEAGAAPDGYRVEVAGERGYREVVVVGPEGDPAARGRFAVRDGAAVVDQVATEPAHRRRGLGRLVMRLMSADAARRGAGVAVLVGTVEGRPLYESLGWRVESDVVAAHVPDL
ncbi:GNAT family N-acetyltransferase [Actinosynnema sp. CA-248983]